MDFIHSQCYSFFMIMWSGSYMKNCILQSFLFLLHTFFIFAARSQLMCELIAGRKSGEENGWISADDVRNHFKERTNKIQYSSIACVTWTGFDRYVP